MAANGGDGFQVWRSDGTDAGTVPFTDFTDVVSTGEVATARGQYFFFKNGQHVDTVIGNVPKATLEGKIKQHLA